MSSEQINFINSSRYSGINQSGRNAGFTSSSRYADRGRPTDTGDVGDVNDDVNTPPVESTTPPVTPRPGIKDGVMDGIDHETKTKMRDMLELIDNQITKYTELSETDDNPKLKQKLNFWKQSKAMEAKIQGRLDGYGVKDDPELKTQFKELYDRRSDMLINKFQQGINADNKPQFYGQLNKLDSKLIQLATGSDSKQMKANRALTADFAAKIKESKENLEQINTLKKELRAKLKEASTADEKTEVREQLAEANENLETAQNKYQAYYTASLRFGGRAKTYSDIDRLQYDQYLKDVEKFEGEISISFLP